jgi:hypothetical protein
MSEALPAHRDPHVIAEANRALVTLNELTPALRVAILLTDDGFEIARYPESETSEQRLPSMASSLQALSDAVVRELTLGTSRFSLIEAAEGRVIMRRIPGHPIGFAAVFGEEEAVGQAISLSRRVVDDLLVALEPTQ